jgi:hypothetical protein
MSQLFEEKRAMMRRADLAYLTILRIEIGPYVWNCEFPVVRLVLLVEAVEPAAIGRPQTPCYTGFVIWLAILRHPQKPSADPESLSALLYYRLSITLIRNYIGYINKKYCVYLNLAFEELMGELQKEKAFVAIRFGETLLAGWCLETILKLNCPNLEIRLFLRQ